MLATLMLVAATAAPQQQDFSWQGNLDAGQTLEIGNIIGTIRVEPASGRRAEVTAVKVAGRRGDPRDVEVRAEEGSRGVQICVRYPTDRWEPGEPWRCGDSNRGSNRHEPNDTRIDFTIRLPAGVHLDAATISGDVVARDLSAEASVTSISGDVRVTGFRGERIHAKTVSGDVELAEVSAPAVEAETVSGSVRYDGRLDNRGRYDFKSLSGNVVVTIPPGTGADLRASTFSGRIRFPEAAMSEVNIRRNNRASARLGEGGASLWVESFSGNVEIRYAR